MEKHGNKMNETIKTIEQPSKPSKPNIKDNWLKEDKLCPSCGQVTERARGITKQSMKRLFSFNWKNPQEWIWIAVIFGVCFIAWTYKQETAACNDFMNNQAEYCTKLLSNIEYGNGEGLTWNGTWNGTNEFGNGTGTCILSRLWNLTQ